MPERKIYSDIDLRNNEVRSARLHNLAASPDVSGVKYRGLFYYDTEEQAVMFYDGEKWVTLLSSEWIKDYKGGGAAFLSKLVDDAAKGNITFEQSIKVLGAAILLGGVQFGDYTPGLAGSGGRIDPGGNAELRSLRLWEWLEVPELRYNRVSVNVGLQWQTSGGGIIDTVTPGTDGTGTCTLKLEDGETGAVAAGDLCMGIWHDTAGNETETSDDNRGNFKFAGFRTVYFRITGVSGGDNGTFTYALRGDPEGGNSTHPFAGMHFAQRGSVSDTSRQSFKYSTTEYTVSLTGVSTWEFQPSNYYMVTGRLDGFSMPALGADGKEYSKEFEGYGTVLGNAYIFGRIDQFERVAYRCFIGQGKGGALLPVGDSEEVTVTVLDGYGADVTSRFTLIGVTRDSGDSASDETWNAAHTSVGNPFTIKSEDLGIDGIHRVETVFTVTATDEATDSTAKKAIEYYS